MIDDPHSFWLEARWQRGCAACGKFGAFHAHHVVDKQQLRRARGPLYDPRNALRLCPTCHFQFEHAGPGKIEIELTKLTDDNVEFAFAVLGDYALDYLRRQYIGHDPRVTEERLTCPRA
jgi:hypothetical protein